MATTEPWTPDPKTGKPRTRARWRTPEGKSRSKVMPTKRAATAYGVKMEGAKLTGSYIDPAASKVTFKAFAEQWFRSQVFDPSTKAAVSSRLKHAWETLGPMPIGAIRPSTVQAWISGLSCGPATARLVLTHVSQVFSAAVDDSLIARNPCQAKSVKAPKATREKVQPFTVDHAHGLVDEFREGRYRAMPAVFNGAGLRQGEAFGLQKGDVDFLGGWLHVRRQVKQATGGPRFGPPKGKKIRKVPLSKWVALELAEQLRLYPVEDLDGLIFTTGRGDGIIRHNLFNANEWKPALRAIGLDDEDPRNGCHRGRHTFASVLLHEGESVAAVAEWMGNTPAVVLRTYAHLMPASEERTRRVIDDAFLPSGVTTVSREAL